MRRAWRIAAEAEFWQGKWYYMPVRYDVSWEDSEFALVVGTYPLGEAQELERMVEGMAKTLPCWTA